MAVFQNSKEVTSLIAYRHGLDRDAPPAGPLMPPLRSHVDHFCQTTGRVHPEVALVVPFVPGKEVNGSRAGGTFVGPSCEINKGILKNE